MNELIIISLAGFLTGITTYMFGFGGGFVVVPFVYQMLSNQYPHNPNVMHVAVATSTAVMIFNSSFATYINWKKGNISKNLVYPLIIFIALGAVIGSLMFGAINDYFIRYAFIVYMVITIIDCLFRKGFFKQVSKKELSVQTYSVGGIFIGIIATILGVGGSVMTVPLLRRHGNTMSDSVACANPLTLPMAIFGSFVYSLYSSDTGMKDYHFIGLINISILILLVIFGGFGISLARFIPKIPDSIHSKIYIWLLICVTIAITVQAVPKYLFIYRYFGTDLTQWIATDNPDTSEPLII